MGYYSLLVTALVAYLLFYMNSCKKCPECPPGKEIVSYRVDTLYIHDTIPPEKTKLTKVVKSKNVNLIDTKKSFVEMVDMCDSIIHEHESMYQFETDVSDSMMTGWIKQTISKNRIVFTEKKFEYHIPTKIEFIDRPTFKNTFTIGTFLSKYSSGPVIGYRSQRVHGAIGWDLNNSSPVVQLNYDLK